MSITQKLLFSLLILLLSGLAFVSSQTKLPVIDEATDNYFVKTLQNATLAYAALRGVNAVVSVIKESTVEVSPAGVGLSLAAGQMLDPVDDMTERASSVVVMALVSLGVQKIGYEVGQVLSMQLLALLLLLMLPFLWLAKLKHDWFNRLLKLAALLLVLRFMLPAFAGLSGWLHDHYFAVQQQQALASLSFITDQQWSLTDFWSESQQDQSWWSLLYGEQTQSKQWFQTLNELAGQLDSVIAALVQLMMLFIVEWLLQIVLLPVLGVWLLYRLIHWPYFSRPLPNQ